MSVMASRPPNMPAGAGGSSSLPSKRPRLSLQIKTNSTQSGQRSASSSTTTATRPFSLNPSDPTAFNTLSNAYVTAIERAGTPVASPIAGGGEPLTAIRNLQAISLCSPVSGRPAARSSFPATPLSAYPTSSPSKPMPPLLLLPSVMSPTPPVSAGAVEMESSGSSRVFSFSPRDAAVGRHSLEQALHAAAAAAAAATTTTTPSSPMVTPPKRQPAALRTTLSTSPPPYTHAKGLRSILRNSPLPSRRLTASSPRRLTPTVRIQAPDVQRAAKRVCYHSPIEQEITTNTYTKSHIDLLVEEASSMTSPSSSSPRHRAPVDLSRVFSANEIQDGGQTPGPFEDESRRLGAAIAGTTTSAPPARSEKKRRWVWTIGREEDAEEDEEQLGGAVVAAARAAAAAAGEGESAQGPPVLSVPQPKVQVDTVAVDVEMSS